LLTKNRSIRKVSPPSWRRKWSTRRSVLTLSSIQEKLSQSTYFLQTLRYKRQHLHPGFIEGLKNRFGEYNDKGLVKDPLPGPAEYNDENYGFN